MKVSKDIFKKKLSLLILEYIMYMHTYHLLNPGYCCVERAHHLHHSHRPEVSGPEEVDGEACEITGPFYQCHNNQPQQNGGAAGLIESETLCEFLWPHMQILLIHHGGFLTLP